VDSTAVAVGGCGVTVGGAAVAVGIEVEVGNTDAVGSSVFVAVAVSDAPIDDPVGSTEPESVVGSGLDAAHKPPVGVAALSSPPVTGISSPPDVPVPAFIAFVIPPVEESSLELSPTSALIVAATAVPIASSPRAYNGAFWV
jgi:hypothetical protein